MEQLVFYVYSENGDFAIEINNDSEEAVTAYMELLSIFGELKNSALNINPVVKMNADIREGYTFYINKYKEKNPKLNRLKQKLDKIEDDKYFFLSNKSKHTTEEIIFIRQLITVSNHTECDKERANLFKSHYEKINELFGDILSKYEVSAFDSSIRKFVGEFDRQKRVCRFCNSSVDSEKSVTFDEKSHSIPEALGNKGLVSNEECDECNHRFGKGIEKDLISYLDVYRVFYGISGKNGVPKIKYDDMTTMENILKKEIEKNDLIDTERLTVISSQNVKFDEESKNLNIQLKSFDKLSEVNIYKALCKMVIGLVDSKELQFLTNTIDWINNIEKKDYELPKVANLLSNEMYTDVPFLSFYVRKDNDYSIPHIVGEFKFKSLIYVFIIPFSKKDNRNFINSNDYEIFWKFFKHYSSVEKWTFHNFSSSKPKKYVFNLNFEHSPND